MVGVWVCGCAVGSLVDELARIPCRMAVAIQNRISTSSIGWSDQQSPVAMQHRLSPSMVRWSHGPSARRLGDRSVGRWFVGMKGRLLGCRVGWCMSGRMSDARSDSLSDVRSDVVTQVFVCECVSCHVRVGGSNWRRCESVSRC